MASNTNNNTEMKNIALLSDEKLAERLRLENCDQYYILVRMHLSFILDLTTDEYDSLTDKSKLRKWSLVPFGKKTKSRGIMDGAPLTQEGICQVYQLIEFLKKDQNIKVEGIFRRTGSLNRQQELRSLLNQGITLDLNSGQYSVHDCASVLKSFLADLPEPLLTEAHYPAYCQIAELCGIIEKPLHEQRLLHSLQLILMMLPFENRVLLKDLLDLLHFTTTFESNNKMSADSLATLFTPHLLCPRKLAPETLHINSQTISGIISFMITNCDKIFLVPPKLAVDIRAYFAERERRKLSPKRCFDESVSDNFAANTVFSFVDHERTAKENESNPTETALAQLYAHIQSMPESSKKRKLVKQFNKENGHGTPLQVLKNNMPKNKSFGDSIKKHIFHKGLIKKKAGFSQQRASSEELLNSPRPGLSKARLFCTNCNSSSDISNDENLNNATTKLILKDNKMPDVCIRNDLSRSLSAPDLSTDNLDLIHNSYLTSTPACLPLRTCPDVIFTPEDHGRKSMSPITRSTQRMCKAMQETMMTPRSRKPVLLISGTNIANIPNIEKKVCCKMANLEEEENSDAVDHDSYIKVKNTNCESGDTKNSDNLTTSETEESLSDTFREYLCSRSMLTTSPTDLSFSSRTDDYSSTDLKDVSSSKLSKSLLHCLDGNVPSDVDGDDLNETDGSGKKLVLKPKQFDENGCPIIYETSF